MSQIQSSRTRNVVGVVVIVLAGVLALVGWSMWDSSKGEPLGMGLLVVGAVGALVGVFLTSRPSGR